MYLCEEYISRHHIKVPYVKHIYSGCVFFKGTGQNKWSMLTINWKDPTYHPGTYLFRIYKPVHDGFRKNTIFELVNEAILHLDEYEKHCLDWIRSVEKIAVGKEVELVAWEIGLYCYDSLLSPYISHNDFFKTIDCSLSVDERKLALDNIIVFLEGISSQFAKAWILDINRYIEGYAHWLAELKNGPISLH